MVPEGWKVVTIGDIGNVITGSTPKTSDKTLYGGDIPFVSPADLGGGAAITATHKTLSKAGFQATRHIRKGATLFTCIGSTIGKIGFAGVDLATNQQINSVIPNKHHDDRYVYYALTLRACHIAQLAGAQAVPIINKSTFAIQPILTPPLPEQRKIAQILSTWDASITATERLLENSQKRKKGLMQQLLTGKKRLPGFEGEWRKKPISETGKIISGGTPDTANAELWGGDILWLTPTDIAALSNRFIYDTPRKITPKGVKKSSASLLPSGSLCVCTRASVGLMAITTTQITTNQGFKSVVPSKDYDIEFLYYLFWFNHHIFIKLSSGSTFLELSKKDFAKIAFNYPPLVEQQAIAQVLTTADQEIEALQQRLACLKQEKKALMQQLLTGKKRVKVDAEKMEYSIAN